MMLAAFVAGLGWFVLPVHIVQHARDLDVPESRQPVLVSCVGLGLIAGRVPLCMLADWSRRRIRVFALVVGGLAAANFAVAVATSFATLLPGCLLYGVAGGAYVALTPPVVKEFVAIEDLAQAAGLVYTAWGWSLMVGPPIAGWLQSEMSPPGYKVPLFCAGACLLLSALCVLGLEQLHNRGSGSGRGSNKRGLPPVGSASNVASETSSNITVEQACASGVPS